MQHVVRRRGMRGWMDVVVCMVARAFVPTNQKFGNMCVYVCAMAVLGASPQHITGHAATEKRGAIYGNLEYLSVTEHWLLFIAQMSEL